MHFALAKWLLIKRPWSCASWKSFSLFMLLFAFVFKCYVHIILCPSPVSASFKSQLATNCWHRHCIIYYPIYYLISGRRLLFLIYHWSDVFDSLRWLLIPFFFLLSFHNISVDILLSACHLPFVLTFCYVPSFTSVRFVSSRFGV